MRKRLRRLLVAEGGDERSNVLHRQAGKGNALVQALAAEVGHHVRQRVPGVYLHVTIETHHEHVGVWQLTGQVLQQEKGRPVCPVQVLQDEDEGRLLSNAAQEGAHCLKQHVSLGLWGKLWWRGQVAKSSRYLRQELGDDGGIVAEPLPQHLRRVFAGDSIQDLHKG